jgi:preprotein translocase subunit Sss1
MKQKIQYAFLFVLVTIASTLPKAASAFSLNLGFSTGDSSSVSTGAPAGGGFSLGSSYGLPSGSIFGILSNLLDWLLAIFAILGIVGFIISGILYLTSAGDDTQIEKAKTAMMYSIMGILVGLIGFIVMQAVFSLLMANNAAF